MTIAAKLTFYLSVPHQCGYFRDRTATTLFVDPSVTLSVADYSALIQHGFRRSGQMVYRPHCEHCHACVPVRIPVREFKPDRSQRRTLQRNNDLELREVAAEFREEHFALYQRYQQERHTEGGMDDHGPDQYRGFLFGGTADTRLYEFRFDTGQLVAVAAMDALQDGYSAVYTFYDPRHSDRGPGVFAILKQIELTRARGLDYLYLGYWIEASAKMRYKTRYQPLEMFDGGQWSRIVNK
jgi:arginine-tRNA-protein transferase